MFAETLEKRLLLATITTVSPTPNTHEASVLAGISATFDENIDTSTATPQTFIVRSQFRPVGITINTTGMTVTAEPTTDVSAGELVEVTATAGIQGATTAVVPFVWQFRTAVLVGSGEFADSGQSLGDHASRRVALGDLDADGDLDAFVANGGTGNRVWMNDGSSRFTDSGQSLGYHNSLGVSLGDLDGDGDLDAFVANYYRGNRVWLNGGSGIFNDTGQSMGDHSSLAVSLGDLDGDGDLDAFVANYHTAERVWQNNGAGEFTDSLSFGDNNGSAIALGDLDGDGDLDALVVAIDDGTRIWVNNDGEFTESGQSLGLHTSVSVALGDIDDDGDLDAIVANRNQPDRVYLNSGGLFNDSGQSLGNHHSLGVALGDLDGDGDLDAFVSSGGQGNRVWENDSGVFFDSGQSLGDHDAGSAGVALGDLDGDGDLDAFVTNDDQGNRVWLNQNLAPAVTLSVENSAIPEESGAATITASLSAAHVQPVAVNLGISGNAKSADDYTISSTEIVIPAGATSGSVTITAVQDELDEEDETVIVDITSVTNGQEAATQQVAITIADDDEPPTVTLTVDNDTVEEDAGVATFTAALSEVSGQDITLDLGISGTASNADDYVLSDAQIVVPAGVTIGTATVTAVQDAVDEPDESIIVDITDVTHGIESGTQQRTVTIIDDDEPPTVSLSVDIETILEAGGMAIFTAALSAPSLLPVTVELDVTGTATPMIDYSFSGTQIVIPAGDTSNSITITSLADVLITEGAETIIVNIAAVTNATEDGTQQATTTIIDDVNGPAVTLSVDSDTISETGGVATVTAILESAFSLPVTIGMAFSGTATGGGTDYSASNEQLVIEPGATTGTVTITGVDDALIEGDETVVVDIASVINGTESDTQQETLTITDDEVPPMVTLSLDNADIAEADGVANFTATLSAVSTLAVTVELGITGTATLNDDFAITATQIVVPSGETTGTATVTAVQDLLDEPDETVVVDILSATNGTGSGIQQQTTTIVDDDERPPIPTVSLAVDNESIAEADGAATITATLSQTSDEPVTVDLGISGTARQFSDYTISGTQIFVAAGATSGSVIINSLQDSSPEGDETVIVDIAAATNAEVGVQQVTVTIEDDDPQPTVSLLLFNASIPENNGTTQLTAFLSGQSGVPVTIDLEYTGTATHGEDFDAPTQIVIPAGGLNATITVHAIQDVIDEEDETIVANIASVDGATGGGSQTITIIDDDVTPSVTLSINTTSLLESIGQATVTAFLSTTTGVPVTVNLDYSSGTATLEDDFTAATQLVIPAGGLNASGIIRSVQDSLDEANETVIVEIATVSNATEAGEQQVTTTIVDDDLPPTVSLSIDTDTISEAAGAAVLTATLSEVSGQDVTVDLEMTGTATVGDDYIAETAIVVPSGTMTGTVTVIAVQDLVDEPDETVRINVSEITNAEPTGNQQAVVTIVDDDEPLGLVVTSVESTSTGFVAHFSEELDTSGLNLYDAEAAGFGAADVVLVGQASGPVAGSVVVDPTGRAISFIKTGGLLATDTYTVTLRSGADAFKTPAGLLLDGDANGVGGDDLNQTFTVDMPATNAVTLTIPDVVRGPGQDVNLPADTAQGIPVSVSEGSSVRTVTLQIAYDPTLLEITGATLAESMPAGATVTFDGSMAGNATVAIDSPTSFPAGAGTLFYLQASIPAAASSIYGRQQILDIHTVMVTDGGETPIPSIDVDALHLASYFADVSGNGRINASDAAQVARIAALLDTGFAATPLIDPAVVGDISGNGRVNAADASLVARSAALIDVPQIPPIPAGVAVSSVVHLGPGLPNLGFEARQVASATSEDTGVQSGDGSLLPLVGPDPYQAVDEVMASMVMLDDVADQRLVLDLEDAMAELLSAELLAD